MKGVAEDKLVRQHQQFNEHEFVQTLGDTRGQKSMANHCPWVCKESDMIEQLNNSNIMPLKIPYANLLF